jgi:hypothetical protein
MSSLGCTIVNKIDINVTAFYEYDGDSFLTHPTGWLFSTSPVK